MTENTTISKFGDLEIGDIFWHWNTKALDDNDRLECPPEEVSGQLSPFKKTKWNKAVNLNTKKFCHFQDVNDVELRNG